MSYQEYNLPISIEYFNVLDKLNLKPRTSISLSNIIEESKRFLGFSLRSNNQYFPVGDSFRVPNSIILNKVFGNVGAEKKPMELLSPFSKENGVYRSKDFYIFRGELSDKRVHFIMTSCWNSANHKKNDELSFCLEINDEIIFDSSGWGAYFSKSMNEYLSSEYGNSSIYILGTEYCNRNRSIINNAKSEIYHINDEGRKIFATQNRVENIVVDRCVDIQSEVIKITDSFELIGDVAPRFVIHRFLLAKDVELEVVNENVVDIFKNDIFFSTIIAEPNVGFFKIGMSKVVSSDKQKLDDVKVIDFCHHGYDSVSFEIKV